MKRLRDAHSADCEQLQASVDKAAIDVQRLQGELEVQRAELETTRVCVAPMRMS